MNINKQDVNRSIDKDSIFAQIINSDKHKYLFQKPS
jgi:hypothetical protein